MQMGEAISVLGQITGFVKKVEINSARIKINLHKVVFQLTQIELH